MTYLITGKKAWDFIIQLLFLGVGYVFLGDSLSWVFLYSRYSLKRWWGKVLWLLWIERARHPGPFSGVMTVEVFNVGGWLTHGDLVLETSVDFLAVVEHRLVPARVRGEWARLRARDASSVWSPASQMLVMVALVSSA